MSEGRQRRTRREVYDAATKQKMCSAETAADVNEFQNITADNATLRLTCTLTAMCSLFALFLCYAEKRSRAIRSFAVQSVGLTVMHLACALALTVVASVLGFIPFLGFLVNMLCWLMYLALAIVLVVLRVRMMLAAWQGTAYKLPLIGRSLERFV